MEIYVYTFADASGEEQSGYQTQNYQDAQDFAAENKLKVICNEFEFADSYMVDDFTGNNDE